MTRRVPQSVPSESGRAGDLARAQLRLLGPAWQAPAGSVSAAQFLAEGDALDAALDALDEALDNAFAGSATSELDSWERVLYLPVDTLLSTANRQTQALARVRGTLSGSPNDLETAVQTIVPAATLREYTATEAAALGNSRFVFTIRVALGTSYGDAEIESKITALLRPAMPAHCALEFGEREHDAIMTEASEPITDENGDVLTTET